MKNSTKYISLGIFICLLSYLPSAKAQFYGVNIVEHCWHTAGGVDSTVYAAYMSAAGTTKPTRYHFFSVTGTTINSVTVSGGTLTVGPCGTPSTDTININLENINTNINTVNVYMDSLVRLIDSLINTSTEPQTCNCTYVLDLDNHAFSVQANSQTPVWTFDRVVTRNCGAGAVEVFRQGASSTVTSKASTFYTQTASPLQNGGVIDSVKIYFKNPDTTAWIYLSPSRVAAHYPILVSSGAVDTADLRYNSATTVDMNAAIEVVMAYGLNRVALTHSPPLSYPTFDFNSEVNSSGHIVLRFYTYHAPTGFYASVANAASTRRLDYHPTASGAQVQANGAGISGINHSIAGTYSVCDTAIITAYTGVVVPSADMNYYTLTLDDPPAPSLSGSLGTTTCSMPCPEQPECIEICNSEDNPIPVTIVTNEAECQVTGIVDFPDPTSSIYQVGSNTVNSITVAVTTGPVEITVVNGSSTKTRTFPTGTTFSAKAGECEFLSTAFSVDASASGAAVLVSTLK